ncbi:unnamed protein product (macronuclear) [Paramecium tetraurelia]|uniref:TLDc domain-containing protein n=1 Tax=Paramecium tetraurelia TaxID=5888 RepID=A0C1V2_PARTE|nr:uncharacterized protein GSPATT00034246001 [Paramecium tetraurelia]CAK64769.1 unnamed protein product [Paramecium tetraurelia]|eukprot:XP_001432166.1 hypothetical protein (macronuclear) [Paramecium tetraurelia strain d4-2]
MSIVQLNYKKQPIQTYEQDNQQQVVMDTLEDILLNKGETKLCFKAKKETQINVIFVQNKIIETEIPQQRQYQEQKINRNSQLSPFYIKPAPNHNYSRQYPEYIKRINFLPKGEGTQKENNELKKNQEQKEERNKLKDFVNEIQFESKEADINELQQIILAKEDIVKSLEEQKNMKYSGNQVRLSDQDKIIMLDRKFTYFQGYLTNRSKYQTLQSSILEIKIFNVTNDFELSLIKQYTQEMQERYAFYINYDEGVYGNPLKMNLSTTDTRQFLSDFIWNNGSPTWKRKPYKQVKDRVGVGDLIFLTLHHVVSNQLRPLGLCTVQSIFIIKGSLIYSSVFNLEFAYFSGLGYYCDNQQFSMFKYARYPEDGEDGYQNVDIIKVTETQICGVYL